MDRLSKENKKWLEDKFGPRVNFNPNELILYSHDIAAVPSLFKPLIGKAIPDAIVQPETEAEVALLARWASARSVPLVPRGAGAGAGAVRAGWVPR